MDIHTQVDVFFGDRMISPVRPQDLVYIGLEPLLGSRQDLDIVVYRRLDAKECDLVVSLQTEGISPVDVVPTRNNCETR